MSQEILDFIGLTPELEKEIKLNWTSKNYTLNIPVIDLQHLWLIFLIYELEKLPTKNLSAEERRHKFEEITIDLVDFTLEHFTIEEGLFLRFDYPDSNLHRKQHQQFVHVLKERIEETKKDLDSSHSKLVLFLKNWLFSHILQEDSQYKIYFNEHNIDLTQYFKTLIEKKLVTIDKGQATLYNKITNSTEVKEIINEDIVSNVIHIWHTYNLSVQIPIIDLQHIWLIKMVVELDIASKTLGTKKRDEIFKSIIKNAVQYTKDHFTLEEMIMEKFQYNGLQNHLKQHRHFIEFIQQRNRENKEGNKSAAHNLVLDLKEWLLSHIAVEDKNISVILKDSLGDIQLFSRTLMSDKKVNIRKSQLDLYNRVIGLKRTR